MDGQQDKRTYNNRFSFFHHSFTCWIIVISDSKKYTLLLSTNTLFGQYSSDWTAILSALILAALPVIGFYAVFQKQILKGIADGAVKG